GTEIAAYPRIPRPGAIDFLAFEHDGRLFLCHSWPGGIATGYCRDGAIASPPSSVLSSDDLLAGSVGSQTRAYRSGHLTWSQTEMANANHPAMNRDTSLMVCSGSDGFALRTWDMSPQLENPPRDPIERQRLLGHAAPISAVAGLGGSVFASADQSG